MSGAFPDKRSHRAPCLPKMRYTQPKLRVLRLHSFTITEVGPFTTFIPLPVLEPGQEHCKVAKAVLQAEGRRAKREAWAAAVREREAARLEKLLKPAKKLELDWEVAAAPQPEEPAAAQPMEIAAALPQAAPFPPPGPDGPVAAERMSLFDACRHVTSLQLLDCIIDSTAGKGQAHTLAVLADLKGLVGLRHLVLDVRGPASAYKRGGAQRFNNRLPSSMWTGLTQLTHLDLSQQRAVDAECIQGLTHLTALQELRLLAKAPTEPKDLAPLQQLQALSVLEIHGATGCSFAPDNASFLAALPKLQHVALLQYNSLEARVFSAKLLHQLQHLHLGMRPQGHHPGLLAGYVTPNGWKPVLAVLADCTALTELRLSQLHDPRSTNPRTGMLYPQGGELDEVDAAARGALAAAEAAAVGEDAAAFAALTASTRLQVLHLSNVSLTPGAWAHIFAADHQLSSLRDLKLSNCNQALGSAAFGQLVTSCPGITALCLAGVLQLNASLQPLLQLTGLRQLQLLQRVQDDVANVLAQLTGLEGLDTGENVDSMLWNDQQLNRMTRLRRLTSLKGCREDPVSAGRINYLNQMPLRLMPDVWLQLSEDLEYLRELERQREEDRMLDGLVSDEPGGYDMAVDEP